MSRAGLLERVLSGNLRVTAGNPFDERYWNTNVGMSAAGVTVTAETALGYDAFFAGVRMIAEDVSTLPVDICRKRPDRAGRDELYGHPLDRIFNVQANDYQLAIEWREWMTRVAVLYPEAVSEIIPGPSGMVEQLRPLHPGWIKKDPDGRPRYEVREPKKPMRYVGFDEVFRLPSPLGVGLVQLARDEIGTALAMNRTQASLMKNGLTPRMALEHPGTLSKEAQDRLSDSVSRNVTGPDNAGHIALFEEGMKWVQIGVSPKDVEFIANMEFSVLQMARWLRVQPHKLAYMLSNTFASVEQSNIEHVIDTIRPWVTRWEMAAKGQLLVLEPLTYIKHNMAAILRGDALSRNQVYEIQRRMGVRNANEIRELEDLNPREDPGGEEYWDTQPGTGGGVSNDPGSKQTPKARQLAESAARRIIEREREALTARAKKHGDSVEEWTLAVTEFYGKHAAMVQSVICVDVGVALDYCHAKVAELLSEGPSVAEQWESRDIPKLVTLALGE